MNFKSSAAAMLLATCTSAPAIAGGIGYPYTVANTYCNLRSRGVDQDTALSRALDAGWDSTLQLNGYVDSSNTKVATRLITQQCAHLWVYKPSRTATRRSSSSSLASYRTNTTMKGSTHSTPSRIAQASSTSSADAGCWSSYLNNNPAMAQWAKTNPAMAAQNSKRFKAC